MSQDGSDGSTPPGGVHPPIVKAVDGVAMADSRDVATTFERKHQHVLEAYRNCHCSEEFRRSNFRPIKIKDLTGESTSHVMMTKNGFAFLVLGFTGAKAGAFKEGYIERFDAMEQELRRQAETGGHRFEIPRTLGEALRLAADQQDQIERQREQIEADKPKTGFFDRFINADGLYGLQNAARALNCRPNLFIRWLKENFMFYQGTALVPRVQFIQMGVFEVKSEIVDDKARPRSFITPKGFEYLSTKVPASIRISKAA